MVLTGRRKARAVRALLAALGALLIAEAGAFAAGHSRELMPPAMPLAANPGMDSACQAVIDASDKLFTAPYHMFATEAGAGVGNKKPVSSEMIFAGGAQYILNNGKWSTSPLSTAQLKEMSQRNRKNANTSCHHVRDEAVNGESAALYTTHDDTAHGKSDSHIWISKGKGLILRQETDIDTGGANGKTRLSVRYEYGDVHAPKH